MPIDFTNMPKRNKAYSGANGSKISVVYDGETYMIKFPAGANRNDRLSYSNSCFSEYIGCHIFEIIGLPVQKTLLGTYEVNGQEKIVVACKDFTKVGAVLQDFASLKNQIIDSERSGYGTELDDILHTIEVQSAIDSSLLAKRFWDMFIVDALIGNWDRHNGNWGFLYDTVTDEIELAPVYDCGSSLYPQADEKMMRAVLTDKNELNIRIFERPTSAIVIEDKRIRYFDFISSLQYEGCNLALKRILPKIDMNEIRAMIDDVPFLNDLQRQFYITMLSERKSRILDYSYQKLLSKDKTETRLAHEPEITRDEFY